MTIDLVVREISSAIHVRHIETPIDHARRFTPEAAQGEVAAYLAQNQFDATPIFGADSGASVIGLVYAADINEAPSERSVGEVRSELDATVFIDASAPLTDLLARFTEGQSFLFVVGGRGVTGIVTPSDMNRQAGRAHLFLELSALELAMAEALRAEEGDQQRWLFCLHPKPRKRVLKDLQRMQSQDQVVDLVACLHFRDLLLIHRDRGGLGPDWSGLTDAQIGSMNDFRNTVMHAVRDVTTDAAPRIEQLIGTTQLISRLLQPFLLIRGEERA